MSSEKICIGKDRPLPPLLSDIQDYIVEFDGIDDPMHPYNWKSSVKYVKLENP